MENRIESDSLEIAVYTIINPVNLKQVNRRRNNYRTIMRLLNLIEKSSLRTYTRFLSIPSI